MALIARGVIAATFVVLIPIEAHAGLQEISRDDHRLPRGHVFVDVTRVIKGNYLYVTIEPPMGAWSQAIECAEGDKALSVSHNGNIVFILPGGKTYYETVNDNSSGTIKSWGVFFGVPDWYATDLSGGGTFSLLCPRVKGAKNTHFETIDAFNQDGTIPTPACTTQGDSVTCTVLSSSLWNRLNDGNWGVGPSLNSHWKAVTRYNTKVQERLDAKRSEERAKAFKAARPNIITIAGFIIGAFCVLVIWGYIKRSISRA